MNKKQKRITQTDFEKMETKDLLLKLDHIKRILIDRQIISSKIR